MRHGRLALAALVAAACTVEQLAAPAATFEVPEAQRGPWYKGNTHTHTTNSDGDSPPEVVAAWYALKCNASDYGPGGPKVARVP